MTTATPGPGSVGGGSIGGSIGGASGGITGPPPTSNPCMLRAPMKTAGTAWPVLPDPFAFGYITPLRITGTAAIIRLLFLMGDPRPKWLLANPSYNYATRFATLRSNA